MAFQLKSLTDFFKLVVGKFAQELPTVDPTIKASIGRAVSIAAASAGYGLQQGISDAVNQMFWQTQDDTFLELTGAYDNTVRNQAQVGTGYVDVEGSINITIPQGSQLQYNGNTYLTLQDSLIQTYSGAIAVTLSAGIVTAVASTAHNLATGLTVTIAGCSQTGYNGNHVVTVLTATTFSYSITSAGLTADTGTYSDVFAILNIQSQSAGQSQNIDSGGVLTINVTGANTSAYVQNAGITGGTDIESIEDYRIRVGESHVLVPGIDSPNALAYSCKKVPGNTRVFIIKPEVDSVGNPITGGTFNTAGYLPYPGEIVIYILRDNDLSIVPSAAILAQTKQQIFDDGQWASYVADTNLMVLAPVVTDQDFTFTGLSPNTTTMQNTINDQLLIFFQDNATIGGTITLNQITSFLSTIRDSTTGQLITSITMGFPSTAIVAASGEIFTRGVVTFA